MRAAVAERREGQRRGAPVGGRRRSGHPADGRVRAVRRGADVGRVVAQQRRARAAPAAARSRRPGPRRTASRGRRRGRRSTGRNTSWPVELAALNTPMTTPRWRTNQRLATIAPKTRASEPVPMPDGEAPQQPELPRVGHDQREAGPEGDQEQRDRDHPAQAEALHQRRRERSGEAVDDEVEAHRTAGGRPRPAELLLQRHQQRPGGGTEAGRGDERRHRHRRDPPGAVDAAPAPAGQRLRHAGESRSGRGLRTPGLLPRTIDFLPDSGTWRRAGLP